MSLTYTYRAACLNVVDGDTLDLRIDCGFGISHTVRVRLVGVDTHEVYGVKKGSVEFDKGRLESLFVQNWLQSADEEQATEWPFVVTTLRDRTGKFGRYLAEVSRRDSGECLNDALRIEFPEVAD